jgi:hypothetical protein
VEECHLPLPRAQRPLDCALQEPPLESAPAQAQAPVQARARALALAQVLPSDSDQVAARPEPGDFPLDRCRPQTLREQTPVLQPSPHHAHTREHGLYLLQRLVR